MNNLKDFRPSIDPPEQESELRGVFSFPEGYLSRVSLYVMSSIGLVIATYLLHWKFPVVLNFFYTDIYNIQYKESPLAVACIVLPIGVPLIASVAFKKKSVRYNRIFAALFSILLGSTFAFIFVPSRGNLVLIPVSVLAVSYGILSQVQKKKTIAATGKNSGIILGVTAILLLVTANFFFDPGLGWWGFSLLLFFINIYVCYNVSRIKQRYLQRHDHTLGENVHAEGLQFFLFFAVLVYPLLFATSGFTPRNIKRRWIGPEDGR